MSDREVGLPAKHTLQCHGCHQTMRMQGLTTINSSTFLATLSLNNNQCWRSLAKSALPACCIRTHLVHADQEHARCCVHATESDKRIANSIRFPFNGFTYFLTLFSKSFSSFPHGTCSLSVSCPYLALDGVYHPFWAAFPNNPTLRKHLANTRALPRTGLSPSMTCCSKQLRQARRAGKVFLETTIRHCNTMEIFNLSYSLFIRHY